MGGAVVVEQVFSWPGMGRLALQSVQARDYPLFQGILLVLVLAAVLVSLAVDLSYAIFDPRVRSER